MDRAHTSSATARRRTGKILAGVITVMLAIAGAALILTTLRQPQQIANDQPLLVPPPPTVDPATIESLLPRDAIAAIDDPRYATAAEANSFMDGDEMIIGVVINGDARAYPLAILGSHEIVNDVIGGHPVAVTWCPLCYTALVFSRQVAGQTQPLSFGVSGKLLRETLVMFDRQSGSLWSQLYGAAIDGPLAGSRLSFFPSVLTEWQTWRSNQPGTMVLSKPLTCEQFSCGTYATNPRGSYDVDPYASYYNSAEEGVLSRQIPREEGRDSTSPKERVLGLRVGGLQRAYPESTLRTEPLINDTLNGHPVLIWFDANTASGAAYSRRLDGQTLTFEQATGEPGKVFDKQTGTVWSAATGQAVSGLLQGNRLASIVSTQAFAFGWYGYFPESETYGE